MTDKINKYEVIERIAEGGFGVVYKARDPYLKRTVAVKTCTFVDDESRQRFFREAQIAARFDHPNVTLVHDFGVEGDEAFLVQEYLSGEDLLHKIQRRDLLPLAAKVEMLLQAARGLRYAHGRGIIHRDIKPGNLRVLENGEVKILDFGIAKPLGGSPLTQQGMTVGTLGYLSPEQIEGKELDKRTDIFSFGVVAYELIGLTSPFSGRDVTSMLRSILGDSPRRLDEIVPDCPSALADVIHRCLRRDRDLRYDDFEALLQDLERVHRDIDRSLVAQAVPLRSAVVKQKDTKPIPVTQLEEVSESDGGYPVEQSAGAEEAAPTTRAPSSRQEDLPPKKPAVEDAASATKVAEAPNPPSPASVVPPAQPESTARRWSPPPPLEIPARGGSLTHDPHPPVVASPPAETPQSPSPSDAPTGPADPGSAGGPPMAKRSLPIPLIVGAAVVGILLLGLLLWMLSSGDEEPPPIAAAPVTQPVAAEPVVDEAPELASVVVVAGPWAEIVDILDADGNSLRANPGIGRTTPVRLQLPPAFYSIVFQHPDIEESAVCQVVATLGAPATCSTKMTDVDVTGYFKETGWWK